jgi:thiamine monophosphate kinase
MNARQRPLESVRVLLVADARRLVTMVADLAGGAARRSSGATPGSWAGIPGALGRGAAADVRQQREEAR